MILIISGSAFLPEDQPPTHYRLLGIKLFESDLDVIAIAADKQMAHIRTFQTGPYSALSQKILNGFGLRGWAC